MSLIDRAFARLDEFRWGQLKRRSAFQAPGRTISYRNPETKKRPVALFGADVNEGFGLDWANYRLARPGVQGVVNPNSPRPERENVHGFIYGRGEPPVVTQEPYQDPAISPRAARTSESTDQKAIVHFTDEVIGDKWDGVVRNAQSRKSFESDLGKNPRTPTLADQAARDLRDPQKYPYDFSV